MVEDGHGKHIAVGVGLAMPEIDRAVTAATHDLTFSPAEFRDLDRLAASLDDLVLHGCEPDKVVGSPAP
jgi:hypothetical protein